MHARSHVAIRAHFRAKNTAVNWPRPMAKSPWMGTLFVRTNSRGNGRPAGQCLLFFAARAAVRWETRRGDNTNPGEKAFDEPSAASRYSWRKLRARRRETHRSFPGAALPRPAKSAGVLPACSAAIPRLHRETVFHFARRESVQGANARRL